MQKNTCELSYTLSNICQLRIQSNNKTSGIFPKKISGLHVYCFVIIIFYTKVFGLVKAHTISQYFPGFRRFVYLTDFVLIFWYVESYFLMPYILELNLAFIHFVVNALPSWSIICFDFIIFFSNSCLQSELWQNRCARSLEKGLCLTPVEVPQKHPIKMTFIMLSGALNLCQSAIRMALIIYTQVICSNCRKK